MEVLLEADEDLANDLIAEGLAVPSDREMDGTALEVVLQVLQNVSAVVTLTQGAVALPAVVRFLRRRLDADGVSKGNLEVSAVVGERVLLEGEMTVDELEREIERLMDLLVELDD